MSGEKSDKAARKKGRGRIVLLVLLILVVGIVGAAFGIGLIRLPECHPAIQEEVDWPPDEPGIYEETSRNRLRTLEKNAFPPGALALCNEGDAPAAQAIAYVPASPRFLIYEADQSDWEYNLYHSVVVPVTGTCLNVDRDNRIEGLQVTPDPDNSQMVWIELPIELDPEQTYMLTAGADVVKGVIITSAPPAE